MAVIKRNSERVEFFNGWDGEKLEALGKERAKHKCAREPLDEFSYRIHYDDHKRWDCRVHFLGNSVITEYYYNDRLVKRETT